MFGERVHDGSTARRRDRRLRQWLRHQHLSTRVCEAEMKHHAAPQPTCVHVGTQTAMECFSLTEKKDYSYLCMWTISNWLERNKNINPTWKILMKDVDLGEPTSFLVNVYLGCTQRECQISKAFWLQKNYQNQKPQENLMPNLCCERNWPDSQSSRPRAEMRMSCAFRTGEYGKNVWTGKSRERRQQKMGETWEGWRRDGEQRHSCDKHLFHELESCVYVTRMKMCGCDCARAMCRKMCVQQVRVCTHPVVHTIVATTCVRTWKNSVKKILLKKKNIHHSMTISTKKIYSLRRLGSEPCKNAQTSSFHVSLDLSWWYVFHQLAFHQSLWVEASRFPEACVSERPTFLISWFSMLPLYRLFPTV